MNDFNSHRLQYCLEAIPIYFILFTTALIFFYFSEHTRKKLFSKLFSFVAINILCIFAGMRAESVGIDILTYSKPAFFAARTASSFQVFIANITVARLEIGYQVLVYITAKLFGSLFFLHYFTEVLIVCPIYSTLKKENENITLGMAIFMFVTYCFTFNVMRASIAASWLVLGYFYLKNKNYKSFILCAALAILFHTSAIIGTALILVTNIYFSINKKNARRALIAVILFVSIIIYPNWTNILDWMINVKHILPGGFNKYLYLFQGNSAAVNKYGYFFEISKSNYLELFYKTLFVISPILVAKKNVQRDDSFSQLKLLTILGYLIYAFSFIIYHTSYGYRISLYSEAFYPIWLQYIVKRKTGSRATTHGVQLMILLVIIITDWLFGYLWMNWGGTLPLRFLFEK